MTGFRGLRTVVLAGLTIAGLALQTPRAHGQGLEVEPNNTCVTAQDMGAIGDGVTFNGRLDGTPSTPDIDFFRYEGIPSAVMTIDLEGLDGGVETLPDPLLGVFDGKCNVVGVNDDARGTHNPHLEIQVPPDGVLTVAATHWGDGSFAGSNVSGSYKLTIGRGQAIGTVHGRLIDAVSRQPFREPWLTLVELYLCPDDVCNAPPVIETNNFDGNGAFFFTADRSGKPLAAGKYQLVVVTFGANGQRYERARTALFTVEAGENHDVGDIAAQRVPSARSVAGRVVDGVTGKPLGGDVLRPTWVELVRCAESGCYESISQVLADAEGRFVFDVDGGGNPLPLFVGSYALRVNAESYVSLTTPAFPLTDGADVDAGDLALQPIPRIASISGRIVDAGTLAALPGDNRPFARVSLVGCGNNGCGTLATHEADGDGRFRFETDDGGRPLPVQEYWVTAFAEQYEAKDSRHLRVREGQDAVLGDVALKSLPIRFSEIRSCGDLPPEGGECGYSVRVANGLPGAFDGAVWSIVTVQGSGSLLGMTRFQTGDAQPLTLPSGANQVVRFSVQIPTKVRAGASICAEAFAGQGATPQFDTLGQRDLFCVTKRPSGFAVLSEAEAATVLRGLHTLLPLPWFETLGLPDAR